MENTKMTYVQALNAVLNGAPVEGVIREKLEKLKVQQESRGTSDKKPTERDLANGKIQRAIVKYIYERPTERFTITQLWKDVPGLPEDMTNQRLNALVQQLLPVYGKNMDKEGTGELIREEDKRKTYFKMNPDYVGDEGE